MNIGGEKDYKCKSCDECFKHKTNLTRHERERCGGGKNKEGIVIEMCKVRELERENDNLKKALMLSECDKEHYMNMLASANEDKDHYKFLLNNAGSIVKTSVSALSYVVRNFGGAPPLEPFGDFARLVDGEECEIVDIALMYFEKGQLDQYIGDIIVKYYKMENVEEQALWNTDTSRLAYLVREIINSKNEWSIDKGGIKVFNYIVNPILQHVKHEVAICAKKISEHIGETGDCNNKLFKRMQLSQKLIVEINSGDLGKKIVRYISPFFYLDKKFIAD